jgi:hypothetical protein
MYLVGYLKEICNDARSHDYKGCYPVSASGTTVVTSYGNDLTNGTAVGTAIGAVLETYRTKGAK